MLNVSITLRKNPLGDSFEMVVDPFLFDPAMNALADIANALIDTGATKSCIGMDVVNKLQLKPKRTELVDTATKENEQVGVYDILLSLCPSHFLPVEVYGINSPKAEAVIIGMDVIGLGDLHIWQSENEHFGTLTIPE